MFVYIYVYICVYNIYLCFFRCMSQGVVAIVGIRTPEQAADNLGALGWALTPAGEATVQVGIYKIFFHV